MMKCSFSFVILYLFCAACGTDLPDNDRGSDHGDCETFCPNSESFPADFGDLDSRFGECNEDLEGAFAYNSGVTAECICCEGQCSYLRTNCQEQTENLPGFSCLEDCCSEREGVYCNEGC